MGSCGDVLTTRTGRNLTSEGVRVDLPRCLFRLLHNSDPIWDLLERLYVLSVVDKGVNSYTFFGVKYVKYVFSPVTVCKYVPVETRESLSSRKVNFVECGPLLFVVLCTFVMSLRHTLLQYKI